MRRLLASRSGFLAFPFPITNSWHPVPGQLCAQAGNFFFQCLQFATNSQIESALRAKILFADTLASRTVHSQTQIPRFLGGDASDFVPNPGTPKTCKRPRGIPLLSMLKIPASPDLGVGQATRLINKPGNLGQPGKPLFRIH